MIRIESLEKKYGALYALKSVDVTIKPGRITAVLGPNGAGKTTLIKSVLGLVKPDDGVITIHGKRINGESQYREQIGYMPQIAKYPENLTVIEILDMIKDIRKSAENPKMTQVSEPTSGKNGQAVPASRLEPDMQLWEQFHLDTEMNKPFRALSGGNRQKTSAVLAFMFRPDILILDEPTTGLDPVSSSVLKDKILAERDRGTTIVLTSHIMSEVQELADHVVFLLEGRIHFEKSVTELLEETGQPTLERAIAISMNQQQEATSDAGRKL